MLTGHASRWMVVTLAAAAAGSTATPLRAQPAESLSPICVTGTGGTGDAAVTAPLDRRVTLHTNARSVRDALDQLGSATGVRLSYSADFLGADRPVCVAASGAALGNVLAELLHATRLQAVVVGTDQVVLSPRRAEAEPPMLAQVVVTGSVGGAPRRGLPLALDVLTGADIERAAGGRSMLSLAALLDGAAPGVWAWRQSPTSLVTRFGSLRGASSFGVSAPKIYVDGIELANPLLLTQIAPSAVERVEIIRGPQGAALYGADAISGVIQIVLRHDGATTEPSRDFDTRLGLGAANGGATRQALTQDYALALRAGSGARAGSLTLTTATVGAFVPGAFARQIAGDAGVRLVGRPGVLNLTARASESRADAPADPETRQAVTSFPLADSASRPPTDAYGRDVSALAGAVPGQRVRQYTLAATGTRTTTGSWRQLATVGIDGYRLTGAAVGSSPLPTPLDSAVRAARGGADRLTLRASTERRFPGAAGYATTLTFAADYTALRDATAPDLPPGQVAAQPTIDARDGRVYLPGGATWLASTGVVGQATAAWHDALFLTGGLRGERNDGFSQASRFALLPSLGASAIGTRGALTGKLRFAYGEGLRPARTAAREATWRGMGRGLVAADLASESQSGTEVGADLFATLPAAVTLGAHVTRFDQQARNLIQQVELPVYRANTPGGPMTTEMRRLAVVLQNVGAISNRGWELETDAHAGPLTVAASLALVDSRVRRIAPGYGGDLRVGDRPLEVPARTLGASATYAAGPWTLSAGASRAADWTNYDRLALAAAASAPATAARMLSGAELRSYWRHYDGVTQLRASLSRDVIRGVAVTLTGDNLLDRQTGEPDDVTVVPGRTLVAGARVRF